MFSEENELDRLGEKIKAIRLFFKETQEVFSRNTTISIGTLRNIERGNNTPTYSILRNLTYSEEYGHFTLWLMSDSIAPEIGQTDIELAEEVRRWKRSKRAGQIEDSEYLYVSKEDVIAYWDETQLGKETVSGGLVHIPLYNVAAAAGNGAFVGHEEKVDDLAFKADWIRNTLKSNPKDLSLIHVDGNSMTPVLNPDDIILIDQSDNTAKRDGIYVIRINDSLLVKRLQHLPNSSIKVISENMAYEPFTINLQDESNDLGIIGRVVWSGQRH